MQKRVATKDSFPNKWGTFSSNSFGGVVIGCVQAFVVHSAQYESRAVTIRTLTHVCFFVCLLCVADISSAGHLAAGDDSLTAGMSISV